MSAASETCERELEREKEEKEGITKCIKKCEATYAHWEVGYRNKNKVYKVFSGICNEIELH